MADQSRLDKIEEILKPHYSEIRDPDVRLSALGACNSDAERAALAEGLCGRASVWATEALLAVLTNPDLPPVEPALFHGIVSTTAPRRTRPPHRTRPLARRLPAHSRQLGEHPADQPHPRGAIAGLLRLLPGLSPCYRRHVRADRRRYQNPRHRLARIARPGCAAAHAAPGPRLAGLDGRRHLDPGRPRRERP